MVAGPPGTARERVRWRDLGQAREIRHGSSLQASGRADDPRVRRVHTAFGPHAKGRGRKRLQGAMFV